MLEERLESNKEMGGVYFKNTTPAHLKKEYKFLKEVDSMALCNTQLALNQSCKTQFAKGKKPKFRCKGKDVRSYTTNFINNNIEIVRVRDCENYIKLPKLGLVRIILHREIPEGWVLKHVTIREKASGKFFVSITFEITQEQVPMQTKFDNMEAFDYSMHDLAVSASGKFDISSKDTQWFRKEEDRLAKEDRKIANMEYGSKNYWDQRHKIGRIHEKVANRRKDFLHKLALAVAETFDCLVLEDINLRAQAQSMNFGKSVNDNGFGMFRVFVAYKLKARGKITIKVSRWFPSTQRCSKCGAINPLLKDFSIREWTCPNCHANHNRDKNATQNLLQEGARILKLWLEGDKSVELSSQGILSEKKEKKEKK